MKRNDLIKFIEMEIANKLIQYGYKKKDRYFMKRWESPEKVYSTFSFGKATYGSLDCVWLAPKVAIVHKDAEDIMRVVLSYPKKQMCVTFGASLGYLMPIDNYLEWKFDTNSSNVEKQIDKYFMDIERFAFPFIKNVSTRVGLIKFLEANLNTRLKTSAEYSLPFLYYLEDQSQQCFDFLDERCETKRSTDDYHNFVKKFYDYVRDNAM